MMLALEDELEYAPLGENEDEAQFEWERIGRFIRRVRPTLRRYGIIARIISTLAHPPHDPVLPPPPPVVFPAEKRRKPSPGQGEFSATTSRGWSCHPALMMEHFGHAAAEAENEAEAQAFIGSLVPAMARLAPGAYSSIMAAAPQLILGLGRAASVLREKQATRPLVRILPTVLRRTIAAATGRSLDHQGMSPGNIAISLARQMARGLSDPRLAMLALRRSQLWDGKYHSRS